LEEAFSHPENFAQQSSIVFNLLRTAFVAFRVSTTRLAKFKSKAETTVAPASSSKKKDRRYFMATMAGERALAYAKATSQTIAGLLEDMT